MVLLNISLKGETDFEQPAELKGPCFEIIIIADDYPLKLIDEDLLIDAVSGPHSRLAPVYAISLHKNVEVQDGV